MKELEFLSQTNTKKVVSFEERLKQEINIPPQNSWSYTNPEFTSKHEETIESLANENAKIKQLLIIICSNLSKAQQKRIADALNFSKHIDDSE